MYYIKKYSNVRNEGRSGKLGGGSRGGEAGLTAAANCPAGNTVDSLAMLFSSGAASGRDAGGSGIGVDTAAEYGACPRRAEFGAESFAAESSKVGSLPLGSGARRADSRNDPRRERGRRSEGVASPGTSASKPAAILV